MIVTGVRRRAGSLARRGRAVLAIHPTGIAVRVVFLLPDRNAVLHFVDDESARIEGFAPMLGADTDPDGQLADRKVADTMRAAGMYDAKTLACTCKNALALAQRQRRKGLVFQTLDRAAVVAIAHPAFERYIAPACRVFDSLSQLPGQQRAVPELKES